MSYIKEEYKKEERKCKQADGDAGNYVLSYTTKTGKKIRNCHTSKDNMQAQIAAIEGPPMNSADYVEGEELMEAVLKKLLEMIDGHTD